MNEEAHEALYAAFASCRAPHEVRALLADLCTPTEVEQMAARLQAASLLLQGKTYAQIIEATLISSATLSRVSNCVRHGSGGYRRVLCPPDPDGGEGR